MSDTSLSSPVDDLRCAPQAVELGLDPRGTATHCHTLVLIDQPGLWPAKIEDLDLVAGLPPLDPGHRILLTRDEAGSDAGPSLTRWRAGDDLRFRGTDYEVAPGRLPDAIAAMADGGEPNEADGVVAIGEAPPEVLVCGHGRRDTCCGAFGIRLLAQAAERAATGGAGAWSGVRVRRCSHTGGHRFAPTALTLPEGRMWAFLDIDLLEAAVGGRPEPRLADANRGLMALDPLAQVAEAALWDHLGPLWRSVRPRIEPSDPGPDGATRFEISWPAGDGRDDDAGDGRDDETGAGGGRATVEVRRSGAVPVPLCGAPIDAATKTSPTFEVVSLTVG